MKTLAIVTTHPIQYNAPWFRLLAERQSIIIKVFYTWSQTKESVKDRTFGKNITWDIPLLEGYDYEFMENKAKQPGSHHFFGINTPDLNHSITLLNPDAILIFGWNFKSHLKVMRYFKGKIPIWFRGDSTLLDETSGLKTILRRHVLKWVYKHVDKALYVGNANKNYFLKHGLTENQLVYVPHAIDNLRFFDNDTKSYHKEGEAWRKELGYQPKDLVILFAGKFESKKQPDFLIQAVVEANKKRKDNLHILMVGHGPMEDDLKLKAKGNDYVRFLPFQNQTKMPVLYRLCNVFCLPSKGPGETWGLAVNEAMASGKPVIVTDKVGCATDLILDNENGFVFSYDDKSELIAILENLTQAQLEIMGNRAFESITNWNFNTIVTTVEKLLINPSHVL